MMGGARYQITETWRIGKPMYQVLAETNDPDVAKTCCEALRHDPQYDDVVVVDTLAVDDGDDTPSRE